MHRLIEFSMEDGKTILVEAGETAAELGIAPAARHGEIATRATQTLETALEAVGPSAEAILARLAGLSKSPSEISIEFGLKLGAQAGAIIASGTVEANYIVKLTWTREQSSK
jgi:hypothetical protein